MTTTNLTSDITMSAPRWLVPSATTEGTDYTITVDANGERKCNCQASDYPRTKGKCWHLKAVASGLAGKPRIRVSQRPAPAPLPTFTRARTSELGQLAAMMLDV